MSSPNACTVGFYHLQYLRVLRQHLRVVDYNPDKPVRNTVEEQKERTTLALLVSSSMAIELKAVAIDKNYEQILKTFGALQFLECVFTSLNLGLMEISVCPRYCDNIMV